MGRSPCCDKSKVKRGTWSPEEDNILKNYMYKHGGTKGGNWATLPQKAGLKRCGKSCRLRWLNYLRPDIKHGAFTQEDDNVICSLYNKIGSRWAYIASQLPGRTDNDVKNYWNTNLKKKQQQPMITSNHQDNNVKSMIPKSVIVSPSRLVRQTDNFRALSHSLTPLTGLSLPPENYFLKADDRILGQELVHPTRSIIDSSTTSAKSHEDNLHHDPSIYSGFDEIPELGNDSSYLAFGSIWSQEEAITEADSNEDLFSILHSLSSGI